MTRLLFFCLLAVSILTACSEGSGNKTVAIQPFSGLDASLSDSIKASIEDVYGFDVHILPGMDIHSDFYVNIKSPRYRADSIIAYLKRNKPDSIDFIIGLTHKDISTTKRNDDGSVKEPASKYEDWGIFGLGYRPGPSCVVSTFRIKTADQSLFMERFEKVCMHELGHNLGLPHCTNSETCVMRDAAETIKTVDQVELKLCETCASKIN